MPPKGPPPKAQKAAVDKTFGMKNKKGGAAQKEIKKIAQQAASAGSPEEKKKAADKAAREREKLAAEQAARETAELFKPVQVQKVPFGVDPKSVLCQFFKKGACEKGKKCKFSHDLDVERRAEKRSLYTDAKDGEGKPIAAGGEDGAGAGDADPDAPKADNSADWDEAKLRSVVMSKHGNPKTTTDKVCHFFIAAVEHGKYGWFWTCPTDAAAEEAARRGDKGAALAGCKYRHSLPPGFVLKTREQRAAEKALMDKSPLATLTLEDFLESERHKLTGTLTPVTPESFARWKKERLDKKAAEDEARAMKEATGRALFEQGGWEASDDEDGSEGDDEDASWMAQMRKETEAARERKEEERIAKAWGVDALPGAQTVVQVQDGSGPASTNGDT